MGRRASNYRKTAYLKKLTGTSRTVGSKITVALPEYDIDNLIKFKYRDSEGKGLTKEQYMLFQNWIMQGNKATLETNTDIVFNKGDIISINGKDEGLVETVMIINTNQDNNIRGNKIDHNKTKVVLYG